MSGKRDINLIDGCCRNDKAELRVCVRKKSEENSVCVFVC